MKLLRIKLNQKEAHYGVEEWTKFKPTYPLPPYSTVIGMLHNACGYKEYHPMNVSIQGKYGSISENPQRFKMMLNALEDDRGILIYRPNIGIGSYVEVAEAITDTTRSRKVSFKNKSSIKIFNDELLDKYISAKNNIFNNSEFETLEKSISKIECIQEGYDIPKDFANAINVKMQKIGVFELKEETVVKNKKEKTVKKAYLKDKEKALELLHEAISKYHFSILQPEIIKVQTLHNVELILHIESDEQTLNDIIVNQNNLIALGRSEDFVEIQEMKMVEAVEEVEKEYKLNHQMLLHRNVFKEPKNGTVYFMNKDYTFLNGCREFNRIPVLIISNFSVMEKTDRILVDGEYIVNLN